MEGYDQDISGHNYCMSIRNQENKSQIAPYCTSVEQSYEPRSTGVHYTGNRAPLETHMVKCPLTRVRSLRLIAEVVHGDVVADVVTDV